MLFHNLTKIGRKRGGFTLVEVVVGSAVFLIIAMAAYQAYASLFTLAALDQYKILAIELANEQFEIVRNMPYANVGVQNGIPNGVIPQTQILTRGNVPFTVMTVVRNITVSLGAANASSTASTSPSEKLVAVTISCGTCKNFTPLTLTTQVAPKNIITDTADGALSIKAFDANGNPVSGASVTVTNSTVTPSIVVNDTTNDEGVLNIVGVATGTSAYQITVTKPGYSTDRTYPPGGSGNPSPTEPNATVIAQQVTSDSFSIDALSTILVSSVTAACAVVPNVGFNSVGSKTIGAGVPKYAATTTTGSGGQVTLNNMEWDTYTFGLNSGSYDLAGLNVLNPVTVNPGSTQNVLLVVVPKNADSLLVAVEDSATLLPLSGATVTLSNGGYSSMQTTGQGFFDQTDWSGGSGQSDYSNTNQYWSDNGDINNSNPAGDINLVKTAGVYAPSGSLQSSIFDTGTSSNFDNIIWQPTNQPVATGQNSVELQIATSPTDTSTTSWNYVGPDGTNGTYYTVSNSPIGSLHNGDRYFRYSALLNTQSSTNTPDISDVAFTYSTACTPPGQVLFQGLSSGAYTLTVSAPGYTSISSSVTVSSSWSQQTVTLGQ
jgi:prepilin-type N-terminal cleavage/methylation domain-containing protein